MDERHAAVLQILALANRLSREAGALSAQRAGEGVSAVNARILGYLAARDGEDVFQRDIERAFSIRRSTVSKVVRLMEQKGLLRREAVARDARLKRLVLTERAREIHAEAAREIADFEARATAGLSAGDIAALRGLLDRICANLTGDGQRGIL